MPRPKKEGVVPKTRSRHGCWPCKAKKIKCDETKPSCEVCTRTGETCDYKIRLNWDGRGKKAGEGSPWSSEHLTVGPGTPRAYTPHSSHASPALRMHSASPARQDATPSMSANGHSHSHASSPAIPNSNWHATLDSSVTQGLKRKREDTGLEIDPLLRSDGNPRHDRRLPPPLPYSTSISPFVGNMQVPPGPVTPAQSIAGSEGSSGRSGATLSAYAGGGGGGGGIRQSSDVKRLSVNYLLQSPPESEGVDKAWASPVDQTETRCYGFDQGLPDLDVPDNDDANALMLQSPSTATKRLSLVGDDFQFDGMSADGFGFGLRPKDTKFRQVEYYARPVPVHIPKSLEPLPDMLLQNPMNLLYFHHFLNHTARILVPHDCPENPFRNILPEMALHDGHLLSLLLAYAASHRSRLLSHRDPANRIADLVKDVFPSLRSALEYGAAGISDASLATAIMLTSLEIISPNAFEVPISWQKHLTIARQMIVSRGGFATLERDGKVACFLSRWFAYLDVMGSLSGSNYDRPLHQGSFLSDSTDPEGDSEIDCLLGFTNRCITILAKVADLAKQCDSQRIGLGGRIRADWRPTDDIVMEAEKLKQALQAARPHTFRRCAHGQPDTTDSGAKDSLEMMAINDSCHWAGLIHLHRRVLGKRSSDEEVQMPVREIAASLDRIRHGGAAEATMIFPMFTAGCEAIEPLLRKKFLDRITSVEAFGMSQVHSAKTLMQRVWETSQPWESLVTGEFFG